MLYTHLTDNERDRLQIFLDKEKKISEIAHCMNRHRSTIYREIARNRIHAGYISGKAHAIAQKRRKTSRVSPKKEDSVLMNEVLTRLRKGHSPEQISGRLKLENPGDLRFHVSHETIYQYVYECIRNGDDSLRQHLRQSHIRRKKRLSGKDKRGVIPGRALIDTRPAIVETKSRRGDWEGDTIEGATKRGYVATFVDRKTKFLVAQKLKNKTAQELVRGACKAFKRIPKSRRKTVTVDNGKEFTLHSLLGHRLGMRIFFARPYHSWERGLNEHTNGLLRQYLPKNKPLDGVTQNELAKIVAKLNNRPRKSLGYRTPREVFFNLPVALRN